MKLLISTLLLLSVPVLLVILRVFSSRLGLLRARLALAVKLLGVAYLVSLAYRLANSDIDHQGLQTAGLSLAFFGGIWLLAWLVTRSMAER